MTSFHSFTKKIRSTIREIPDFPKPGILFYDITPVLADPELFTELISFFYDRYQLKKIDKVIGLESRGFIFAAPLAIKLEAGFIPIRKPGKLPAEVNRVDFDTEYSSDGFEIHLDALSPGDRVLIVDDLLATGGTAKAAIDLVRESGAELVGAAVFIELSELDGRAKLPGTDIFSFLSL